MADIGVGGEAGAAGVVGGVDQAGVEVGVVEGQVAQALGKNDPEAALRLLDTLPNDRHNRSWVYGTVYAKWAETDPQAATQAVMALPASRERLQQELALANQALIVARAETAAAPVPLESSKVISLKNDLGLAVINTGAESGLRLGTPMRLVRGEKIVATGLVVDVRSRIAGLLMTSTSSAGALKVGDLAKPETISTLK